MAIDRPKILTRVTVPTGGWGLRFTVSISGSLDTALDATVAAGNYFVAWDMQSDDLIYQLMVAMNAAIDSGMPPGSKYILSWLDSDNKVNIGFTGSAFQGSPGQDVAINWSHANTNANLAAALGFDTSGDDTSTGSNDATFTADYPHAYGWYASEDGWLESMRIEDSSSAKSMQVRSLSGRVSTQYLAEYFGNSLNLSFVPRANTFSNGVAYGVSPVYPYARNVPLECWWEEARKGVEFRVYRDGRNDTTAAVTAGVATGATVGSVTDSSKSFATDPQRHKGGLFVGVAETVDWPSRFYISSHTATQLVAPNSAPWSGGTYTDATEVYSIVDQFYRTYVVDIDAMREFEPNEIPLIDRFSVSIPMMRYVA